MTVSVRLCGYGDNISDFQSVLTKAGEEMGITLNDLDDLTTDQSVAQRTNVLDVVPDSSQHL